MHRFESMTSKLASGKLSLRASSLFEIHLVLNAFNVNIGLRTRQRVAGKIFGAPNVNACCRAGCQPSGRADQQQAAPVPTSSTRSSPRQRSMLSIMSRWRNLPHLAYSNIKMPPVKHDPPGQNALLAPKNCYVTKMNGGKDDA